MEKVLSLGMGKVGTLVSILLSNNYKVTAVDKELPYYDIDLPFVFKQADVTQSEEMMELIAQNDAVVSSLPYYLNKEIARLTHEAGKHYFDLTEDVQTTNYIRDLSKTSKGVMAPQCGLAPGIIGIIGADLANPFTKLRDIELRVGALPKYPNGLLAYSFTWSPDGVINEYINDAEAIVNRKRKMVPSLEGIEYINIEGKEFEAFFTSGGLGTMCETYDGKLDTLNYKSIRYPGHGRLMKFLTQELILKDDINALKTILENAKPPVEEDVVYIYAVVEGWKQSKITRSEYYNAFYSKEINGYKWRAISWTTAASLAAVVELVAEGKIPASGFIKQEEIPLNHFLNTSSGKMFQ